MRARPIYVKQRENGEGEFWYTVQGGNAENVLTSKMYTARWRAVRAARAFSESIAPAPVVFKHYSGSPTPQVIMAGKRSGGYRMVSERVR